ncbi:LysE family translocator [Halorhabdus sp. BNX81]|uniref:LysE family translocator n=1 Tax=Halorhabdus sp. BNX81 TaxID=2980181 RepID=UPI0023DD4973|nr:LysE family translocator [Halorhabdus sp. BNX81]WEL21287.1 LysE family transporter [Halorhabdus sp. BNX81]
MIDVLVTGLAGSIFGLALAAPPGPMNAVIAEESVVSGFRAGVTAGLGALLADATFLALSLLGVVTIVREATLIQGTMVGVGGVLMLYFAFDAAGELDQTFTTFEKGESEAGSDSDNRSNARGFRRAFVLALTNPYQIIFWLTVGVGLLTPGTVDVLAQTPYVGGQLTGLLVVRTGEPTLLVGLFAGIAVWIVGFPATLVSAGKRIDRFAPAVAGLSAVFLAGFGVFFLFDALSTFGVLG